MNIFDIGIILIFIMFFITGFKKGVIKELVSLIGIIIVFVVSYSLKGVVGNILCTFIPFIKFTGNLQGIVTINILFFQIIAFILIFSILLGIYETLLTVSKWIQKIINMTIILIIPSKILGGLVALIDGYILVFAVLIILMIPFKNQPIFYESTMVNRIIYKTPVLSGVTNKFTTSVEEIYSLVKQVATKDITANEANLKSLDVMLKYKIVSKEEIQKLIELHKLDDIKNIDLVMSKY